MMVRNSHGIVVLALCLSLNVYTAEDDNRANALTRAKKMREQPAPKRPVLSYELTQKGAAVGTALGAVGGFGAWIKNKVSWRAVPASALSGAASGALGGRVLDVCQYQVRLKEYNERLLEHQDILKSLGVSKEQFENMVWLHTGNSKKYDSMTVNQWYDSGVAVACATTIDKQLFFRAYDALRELQDENAWNLFEEREEVNAIERRSKEPAFEKTFDLFENVFKEEMIAEVRAKCATLNGIIKREQDSKIID